MPLDSLTAAKQHQDSERALFRVSEWVYANAQDRFLDDVTKGMAALSDEEFFQHEDSWALVVRN